MRMKIIIPFILLTSFRLYGQNSLNKPSGELEFSKIINSTETSAKLSDFKSKVVLLDFWATWCLPCIQTFPHLEDLQKKFGNDLKIITITDEPEDRINQFLKKKNILLPIAIDTNRTLAAAFPHRMIPHTVVIDQNGIIKAVTTPEEINDDILKQIISGQQINLPEKVDDINFDPSKPLSANTTSIYQITITPYQDGFPSMSNTTGGNGVYKNRRIFCTNLSPQTLYEVAYQYPPSTRTIVEVKDKKKFEWNAQNAICFDLIVPEEIGKKRFQIMQQQLGYVYNYKAVIEKRQMKCKTLKLINRKLIVSKISVGGEKAVNSGGSGLTMKSAEMNSICEFLEGELNMPVIDNTGLKDTYDLDLKWYNENPGNIYKELKNLGLQLANETRSINVLVIYDK